MPDISQIMKNSIKIVSLALLFILTVSLCSCNFDESKRNLSGGILLDDEMISEIKNEILSREEEKENTEEITLSTEAEPDTGEIVYWTESGSVWHKTGSCSHIKDNPDLFAGTASEARAAGKSHPCSQCFD
jgi:hypothetical protein